MFLFYFWVLGVGVHVCVCAYICLSEEYICLCQNRTHTHETPPEILNKAQFQVFILLWDHMALCRLMQICKDIFTVTILLKIRWQNRAHWWQFNQLPYFNSFCYKPPPLHWVNSQNVEKCYFFGRRILAHGCTVLQSHKHLHTHTLTTLLVDHMTWHYCHTVHCNNTHAENQ